MWSMEYGDEVCSMDGMETKHEASLIAFLDNALKGIPLSLCGRPVK